MNMYNFTYSKTLYNVNEKFYLDVILFELVEISSDTSKSIYCISATRVQYKPTK